MARDRDGGNSHNSGSGNSQNFGSGNKFGTGNNFNQGDNATQTTGSPAAADASPSDHDDKQAAHGPFGDKTRNVFIIHGRDEEVRREMFALLRRLDLRPLEWEDLVKATGHTSPYLGEVVAQAPAQAQVALVLLTPDDQVSLHPDLRGENEPDYETQPTGQPRPNVLIELGMVLMAYPERTLMVEVGALRQIADIAGRNVIRFDGTEEAINKIAKRLKQAGCQVDDSGPQWRETWPFRHLGAYSRRPGSTL